MSREELNEEALIEAISSNIDSGDPDARQKARDMADILVHLATSTSKESEKEGKEGSESSQQGRETKQTEQTKQLTILHKWYGPISRLPKG